MGEPKAEGYVMDADDFEKFKALISELNGGTDAMRDIGHKLWCLMLCMEDCPITLADIKKLGW